MTEQEIPEWIDAFLNAVADCLAAASAEIGVGARCLTDEETESWQIDVFPRRMDQAGSRQSPSGPTAPGFSVDFEELRRVYQRVDASGWDATGLDEPTESHLWIDGSYQGEQVLLRILTQAPHQEGPGGEVEGNGYEPG